MPAIAFAAAFAFSGEGREGASLLSVGKMFVSHLPSLTRGGLKDFVGMSSRGRFLFCVVLFLLLCVCAIHSGVSSLGE